MNWTHDISRKAGTKRLLGVSLDREGYDGTDVAIRYGYDAAGNVTSMKDQPTADAVSGASLQDNQCFGYDGLRRLSVAWTAGDGDCAVAQGDIQTSDVGGVEPYWTEYEYDPLGNRTLLTEHAVGSAAGSSTTYEHGTGAAGPHQVTETTKTVGSTDSSPARDVACDGCAEVVKMAVEGDGYWQGKMAQTAASAALAQAGPDAWWHAVADPIVRDWENNPGHTLGGAAVMAATIVIPGGAALKASA